jgi:hypothetical protein
MVRFAGSRESSAAKGILRTEVLLVDVARHDEAKLSEKAARVLPEPRGQLEKTRHFADFFIASLCGQYVTLNMEIYPQTFQPSKQPKKK